MTTMELLSKKSGVLTEMQLVVKLNVKVAYVKAMEKRLTTSEATAEVVLRTSQLGLLVVQQIGVDNLNVLKHYIIK